MIPRPLQIVPAGKRPKLKNRQGLYDKLKTVPGRIALRVKQGGVKTSYFIITSSFILAAVLFLQVYLSHYVYVVVFDGREIGVVRDEGQVTDLILEITESLNDYYGLSVEPGNSIKLVKDYRPETAPDPELARAAIRQEITFLTDAYLIMVDDNPLVPVASEQVLDEVVDLLKKPYLSGSNGSRVLDINIVENLSLKPCSVPPKELFNDQEVLSLLVEKKVERPIDKTYWAQAVGRSFTGHHQSSSYPMIPFSVAQAEPGGISAVDPAEKIIAGANIHVQTTEELVVTEPIPFEIETTYEDEMWVVQEEIITPGQDGMKELVYQITRQNGEEVARTKVSDTVTKEPVTQEVARGTAQVPSKGTGQFIWPVEGGGEVTPGRGFSSWHTGVDIDAKAGTNVFAADSGVVWFSGFGGSQGNYIIIYHGTYWTLYLHNQVNLVKKGARVDQGDVIARVGSTGRSTGPHLHFEVRRDDGSGEWRAYYQHKPVDPLQFFRP